MELVLHIKLFYLGYEEKILLKDFRFRKTLRFHLTLQPRVYYKRVTFAAQGGTKK